MNNTVAEVARWMDAKLYSGDADFVVTGLASLTDADEGDLAFLSDGRYVERARVSLASVLLTSPSFLDEAKQHLKQFKAVLIVDNPSQAFTIAVNKTRLERLPVAAGGISSDAVVDEEAVIGDNVSIAAGAVVERGVEIGEGAMIGPNCVLRTYAKVGKNSVLRANVVIEDYCEVGERCILHAGSVLGGDGFGYNFQDGKHVKIEHVGNVVLGDDVEIGVNSCIDRARFGSTRIGSGTKIDNLVQVGHNIHVGKHVLMCAQVGIAGSTRIGNYTVIAAQVGIAGHLLLGDGLTLGAKSGVTGDLEGGRVYAGFPTQDAMNWRRSMVSVAQLPKTRSQVRKLEKRVEELEAKLEQVLEQK